MISTPQCYIYLGKKKNMFLVHESGRREEREGYVSSCEVKWIWFVKWIWMWRCFSTFMYVYFGNIEGREDDLSRNWVHKGFCLWDYSQTRLEVRVVCQDPNKWMVISGDVLGHSVMTVLFLLNTKKNYSVKKKNSKPSLSTKLTK